MQLVTDVRAQALRVPQGAQLGACALPCPSRHDHQITEVPSGHIPPGKVLGVAAAMAGLVSAADVENLKQEEGAASKAHLPPQNLKVLATGLLVLSLIFKSLITALEVPVCS